MATLDFSKKRIDGGYFTLSEKPRVPYDWLKDSGNEEHFLGTYCNSGAPIRDTLVRMLRKAKRNVFIASFVLGDKELLEEIVAAADRLRGGVYVICALDDKSLRRGLEDYGEESDESPEERKKNFERLTTRGVYVRGHESCHAKFAIVDDSEAVLGSANFVRNGFDWTGEANVRISKNTEVRRLKSLFTALWYQGCTFEVPPGSNYLVVDRVPTQSPLDYPDECGEPGSVVWTDGDRKTSLLASIKQVIVGAKRSLTLSSYSIVGMTDNPDMLFEDIVAAVNRGVKVRLFVRQRNAFAGQRKELEYLHNQGVAVFGDTRNHAKVAIADDADAVLFSANFDAKHGLDSGVEVGYRLSHPDQVASLTRYMEHAIGNADTNYIYRPTLEDLDGGLAARWCSEWGYQDVLSLSGLREITEEFQQASMIPPALYEERKDGAVNVWIGNFVVNGRLSDGRLVDIALRREVGQGSDAKLEDWLGSVRRKAEPDVKNRGFFAGSLEG